MNKTAIYMATVALTLASLACSITVPFPTTEIKTGPTQTKDIHVPAPAEAKSVTFVTLRFGAGQLNVAGRDRQPGRRDGILQRRRLRTQGHD